MKKNIYYFTAALFTSAMIAGGCRNSSEKVEKAKENVTDERQDLLNAERDYTVAIEQFRKETNEKIMTNEKNIAELKEKIEKEDKSSSTERKKEIARLESLNEALKNRLKEYKENGKEGWESFKREFNHDMDELGKALKDLTVNNEK